MGGAHRKEEDLIACNRAIVRILSCFLIQSRIQGPGVLPGRVRDYTKQLEKDDCLI